MSVYKICSRCVLDTTDPDIDFDENGVCCHCRRFELNVKPHILPPAKAREQLCELVAKIKAEGTGKPYDCIMGISGGVDSSYLAYITKQEGLRVLLVHMDNHWDSELAVNNIENIVRKTGFDYYNYIIDWDEFRDLQRAYLLAGVIDVEVVTDNAIVALLFKIAKERNIRYMLDGCNLLTESIMPKSWSYHTKTDLANLRAIHKAYGRVPLRTYPTLGLFKQNYYYNIRNIKSVKLLNLVDYNVTSVKATLAKEFGWREYPGKHYESIFTKFYQAYILPTKFNADKRKGHLSNLICSGQITRDEALARLSSELYPETELRTDYEYVTKKLGFTDAEFDAIMKASPVPHSAFPSDALTQWQTFFLAHYHQFYHPVRTCKSAVKRFLNRKLGSEKRLQNRLTWLARSPKWLRSSRVALYGAGLHTERLFQCGILPTGKIIAIFDDDPKRNDIAGIPIHATAQSATVQFDLLVISSDAHENNMLRRARTWLLPGQQIVALYKKQLVTIR